MIELGAGAILNAAQEAAVIGLSEGDKSDITIQLTDLGSWNGTLAFEGSLNGTGWGGILGTLLLTGATGATTTGAGIWRFNAAGLLAFRVRCSVYSAGSMGVIASVAVER